MKTLKISESEWEIMKIIWTKAPVASSEIVNQLSEQHAWHSRTIRTLLDRLVKKGAVAIKNDGRRNLYHPEISREECVRAESASFLERVFGGQPTEMLAHLVKETRLSSEDIKKLKQMLKDKEK